MTKLYIMTGPAGCGKTTWIKQNLPDAKVISRDAIRFALLGDKDDYFAYENQVVKTFIEEIQKAIDNCETEVVADATHLTPKSRQMILNKLVLDNVEVIAVAMHVGLNTCLEQNAQRSGRAFVPETVIKNMWKAYIEPTVNEKYINQVITSRH